MGFLLVNGGSAVPFVAEECAYEGVYRVIDKVREDVRRVSGKLPHKKKQKKPSAVASCVFVGTLGNSPVLDYYEKTGAVDFSDIRGKRECYRLCVVGEGNRTALLIAGSDKRGTIYGLFSVSEAIGVTPWVYFADATPKKKKEPEVGDAYLVASKEPSVKYRGFFINDEWPSFGGWTTEKFGGFTAEMYDHVFELLLRMKGNYLWPAMWSSSFPMDGPDLLSAELADVYGIVMGTSHHEPCLRASEEWDKVRGELSIYGNEWNYYTNAEGLKNYWRDGLKRSGKLENIITVGMRGERDSSMLGPDATLGENIELLKDIITEQKKLIRENVDENLEKVPMMLALYKEVEAYYYGDEKTPGLKEWEGLDGITLMLCEDNFGNMRTLPREENRNRKGGYGMYYHFDYHGGPISYEWINSTPLAKVWEQMSEAYDYGVRDIWVVNVGDLKPQELPLSFFCDLAYDFEKYGTNAPNTTEEYTKQFVRRIFDGYFDQEDCEAISGLLSEYTRMNGIRRPEVLNASVFHPTNYYETEAFLQRALNMMGKAQELKAKCKQPIASAFYELVYYPVMATGNLFVMQLSAGLNRFYAMNGFTKANRYFAKLEQTIQMDTMLTEGYHKAEKGKWNHMMSSAHIGFVNWNDEGWRYPTATKVFGISSERVGLRIGGSARIVYGGITDFSCANTGQKVKIELLNASAVPVEVQVVTVGECTADFEQGMLADSIEFELTVAAGTEKTAGMLQVNYSGRKIEIRLERVSPKICGVLLDETTGRRYHRVSEAGNYAVFDAGDFLESSKTEDAQYCVLRNYGRTGNSIKVFPTTTGFSEEETETKQVPTVRYCCETSEAGEYECALYVSPTNPLYPGDRQCIGLFVNDGPAQVFTTLPEHFVAGNCWNREWNENVLSNVRICRQTIVLEKGENYIGIAAADAGVILQKMVLRPKDCPELPSYLGPEDRTSTL